MTTFVDATNFALEGFGTMLTAACEIRRRFGIRFGKYLEISKEGAGHYWATKSHCQMTKLKLFWKLKLWKETERKSITAIITKLAELKYCIIWRIAKDWGEILYLAVCFHRLELWQHFSIFWGSFSLVWSQRQQHAIPSRSLQADSLNIRPLFSPVVVGLLYGQPMAAILATRGDEELLWPLLGQIYWRKGL